VSAVDSLQANLKLLLFYFRTVFCEFMETNFWFNYSNVNISEDKEN